MERIPSPLTIDPSWLLLLPVAVAATASVGDRGEFPAVNDIAAFICNRCAKHGIEVRVVAKRLSADCARVVYLVSGECSAHDVALVVPIEDGRMLGCRVRIDGTMAIFTGGKRQQIGTALESPPGPDSNES